MKRRILSIFLASFVLVSCFAIQAGAVSLANIDFENETIFVATGTQWTEDPESGIIITTALWDDNLTIGTEEHSSYRLFFGNTLYFRDTENDPWVQLVIPERPAAPDTVAGGHSQITGVSADMEYALAGGDWQPCTGSTVTGLAAGTYRVRYRATSSAFASESISVRVMADAISFTDVGSSSYCAEAVDWAVTNGVTMGTTNTTFSPTAPCNRAQVITFLWRAAGCPEPKSGYIDFDDVPSDSYYFDSVLWAQQNAIVTGTGDFLFSPARTVTRAQVVTFLWRAAGEPAASGTDFTDVPSDAYYAQAVAWAVENGITLGTTDTTFSPNAPCTRAQVVTFLYRAYNP